MADAIVFPGQGSQSVGMQADLADAYPVVRETWAEAAEVLGYDLWDRVQNGTAAELGQTTTTQPAMLAAGVAAYRAYRAAGGTAPHIVAGHSLGEYSALVAAEAVSFEDAMRVVVQRSQLMQDAVPLGEGKMAAILGLSDEALIDVCEASSNGGVVEAVNFNAPGQVVIAGHTAAVDRAIVAAKAAGARRALPLPVSVPSHSSLLKAAGEALARSLEKADFKVPAITVVSAADASVYGDAADTRKRLSQQVYCAVQWVRTSEAMVRQGAERVIESGPGKVLAGLQRRIDRNVAVATLDSLAGLEAALVS